MRPRIVIGIIWLCIWIYFAYRSWSVGDTRQAGIYLLIGVGFFALRMMRAARSA